MARQLTFSFQHQYPDHDDGIVIPVSLAFGGRSVRTFACVDPGAACCIFSNEVGVKLGLDIESGLPKRMGSLAGTLATLGHEVTLQTLEISFQSFIYFAKYPGVERNLLGRTGWLDRLRIALIHYDSLFYYDDYNR
jgi:hypothetical protein